MKNPAYIFDLDGTLVDTAPDLLAATNITLRSAGRAEIGTTTFRHMVGFGAPSLIEQAFAATGEPVTDEALPALLDTFLAHYRANIAVASRPFANVESTLAQLKKNGAALAVLTNKPHDLAELLLHQLDLMRFFGTVFGAGARSYKKPDPRLYHDAIAALGAGDRPSLMIGDSVTDVATARAARVKVILVSYGYTPEPAHALGADAVTDDFAEIPELARRLGLGL